jgi:ABC-2 type transport system ATP-binding protein
MQAYAIRTKNLTRDFPSVRAVDSLTLEVPTGSAFGFLGPNGAGKTTTIRLLLGLLEPSSGGGEVLGFDIRNQAEEIRQRCGALLEHDGLYERMTAEDNLEFYGRVWRMAAPERAGRIQELLTHLGLWERRKEPVGNWSRGMKQKLAVARALIHRPSLLFLDEPTAGLDPVAAAKLREDLAGLVSSEGVTVFLTTHNLAEAEKLCHRIGIIRQGKLIASGPPAELRASSGTPQVEIVGKGFDDSILAFIKSLPEVVSTRLNGSRLLISLRGPLQSAPLVSALVARGVEVEEVLKSQTSLEEVFLKLVEEDEKAEEGEE